MSMPGGADRVIGVDVGGTKIAAGIVDLGDGAVANRLERPTRPERGGPAILAEVSAIVSKLVAINSRIGSPIRIGVAVCELVDLDGNVTSNQTLDWLGSDVAGALAGVGAATVASDVRAGSLAEAWLGAGRSLDPFLYVSVGTGISHSLVQAGIPYAGRHGTALVASSGTMSTVCPRCGAQIELVPEEIASGPGMVRRYAAHATGPTLERTEDVLVAADAGDEVARRVVDEGGRMLGTVVAGLVNVLDPEAVVVGGGLGLVRGRYRDRFLASFTEHIWAPTSRDTPVIDAALGPDAVLVGAALSAAAVAEGGRRS
jgi:glucokinase